MNELFEFFGTIRLKADDLYKGLDKVTKDAKTTADGIGKKFKNVGTNINKTLQGVATGLSGSLSAISTFATKAGNELTNKITKPVLAVGSALAGFALKKGWDRLIGIDTARAQLQGLGHDAQSVDAIMENALAAVKGTAFGMAEAATTAATAVAAGIQPGEELTKYLMLVGDAAAIGNAELGEMGSIFNKIATSNRVQADELNQLNDRGIPIIQMLAKELGVAEEEVRKLAAEGKISLQSFLNAVETGVGGAAAIIGATSFKAAWANIGASIGRIGAQFLDAGGEAGGFFSQLKPLMSELNEWLGTIESKAAVWGERFGQAFNNLIERFRVFQALWGSLSQSQREQIQKTITSVGLLMVALGPILKVIGSIAAVGATATKGMNALSKFFGKAAASAAAATGKFATFQGAFMSSMGVLSTIGSIGLGVGAFGGILAVLGLVQEQFGDQLDSFFHMAETQGDGIIRGYVSGITKRLPELINQGTTLVTNFLGAVAANLPAVIQGGAQILSSLITGVADNLPRIIEVFTDLWDNIKELMISIDWGEAASTMMTMLGNAIRGYINLLGDIGAVIKDWISEKLNLDEGSSWSDIGSKILENIKSGIGTAKSTVGGIAEAIRSWIAEKIDIGDNAGWIEIASTILGHIVDGIGKSGQRFGEFVRELIIGINGAMTAEQFNDMVDSLLNFIAVTIIGAAIALKKIATALVNGIALGLLGVDNWGDVKDNIFTSVENVLSGQAMDINWLDVLNLNPANWDWSDWEDTIWAKIYGLLNANDQELGNFSPSAAPSSGESTGSDNSSGFGTGKAGGSGAIPTPTIDTSAVDTLLAEIEAKINAAVAKIEEMGRNYTANLIDGMTKGITTNQSKVTLNIGILGNQMKSEFDKEHNKVNQSIQQAMNKFQVEYRSGLFKAYATVRDNLTRISEAFRSQIAAVTRAGVETGRGFYNGLNSQRGRIIDLARSIARSVDSTIRDALDINSPSRVAEDTFGEYINGALRAMIRGADALKQASQYAANGVVQAPNIHGAQMAYAGVRTSEGALNELRTELNEFKQLMKLQIETTKEAVRAENIVFLDGKKVSVGLHDPMNEYSKARENLKNRQSGKWT